jgi:hypothetical protein
MRLHISLLISFIFLSVSVEASKLGQGFEALVIYYAYKMDFIANTTDKRTIATACVGDSDKDHKGLCTFDELMKHIMQNKDIERYIQFWRKGWNDDS